MGTNIILKHIQDLFASIEKQIAFDDQNGTIIVKV